MSNTNKEQAHNGSVEASEDVTPSQHELNKNDKNQENISDSSESLEVESDENAIGDDLAALSKEELIEMVQTGHAQMAEMKDGVLRAKAEMENIRRRSQNEAISARKFAIEGFAKEVLSVKDNLDRAASVALEEGASTAVVQMKEGLSLTLKELESALEKFAVVKVEAGPGVKFDPEQHQAISMIDSKEIESNHIISVMQSGFKLKDRLLRPAMVVVAS